MTQHSVIELECMLDFTHHSLIGLDVDTQVMGLGKLVDHVDQLAPTPVFDPMDLAAAGGDHGLVALQHGWNLLALIRVDHENYFVMTHAYSLWMALSRFIGGRK